MCPALEDAHTGPPVSGGLRPPTRRGDDWLEAEGGSMANQSGKGGAAPEEFREDSSKGPSSQTDDRGLEGSVLEGDEGRKSAASKPAGSKSTGAGAEAAE